jgi:hypothetical protein
MGKRRRMDNEQQQPDYEQGREPAAYSNRGSSQRSDGSGSRCDPELVSYLTVGSTAAIDCMLLSQQQQHRRKHYGTMHAR